MKNTKLKYQFLYLFIYITILLSITGCSGYRSGTATDTEFILDTVCTVSVTGASDPGAIISDAFSLAKDIQNKIDYYNESSTVSKFNSAPANSPISLDDDTFEIIKCALEISESSGGAFDITIAPITDLWDFKSDNPVPPNDEQIENALAFVGYKNLILDVENKTLAKAKDGIKINLGGCGKGYVCEKITKMINNKYPDAFVIIDLGGNTGVSGSNPRHKDGHTTVGIQQPFEDSGVYKQTVDIYSGQSVVTSGTYQRHFYYNDKNYHHIIDPESGYPAETGSSSVTVISDSSLLADCLSTACFVLGEEQGTALAEKYGADIIWIE